MMVLFPQQLASRPSNNNIAHSTANVGGTAASTIYVLNDARRKIDNSEAARRIRHRSRSGSRAGQREATADEEEGVDYNCGGGAGSRSVSPAVAAVVVDAEDGEGNGMCVCVCISKLASFSNSPVTFITQT